MHLYQHTQRCLFMLRSTLIQIYSNTRKCWVSFNLVLWCARENSWYWSNTEWGNGNKMAAIKRAWLAPNRLRLLLEMSESIVKRVPTETDVHLMYIRSAVQRQVSVWNLTGMNYCRETTRVGLTRAALLQAFIGWLWRMGTGVTFWTVITAAGAFS